MPPNRALNSTNWRSQDVEPRASSPGQQTPHRDQRHERNQREKQRRVRKEQETRHEPTQQTTEGPRIYVGNMPYTAQRRDVAQLFEAAGFSIVNIDISIDPFTSRNPSYCFVDLPTTEAATTAMQTLAGVTFLGRPLKIKPCVQKRTSSSRLHSETLVSTRWRESARPTAELLEPTSEGRRLWVGGLPKPLDQHTSDLELRDLFRGFGVRAVSKVKSPVGDLNMRAGGNGWYAFVDFESAEEAGRAVEKIDGREMWGGKVRVSVAVGGSAKRVEERETEQRRP